MRYGTYGLVVLSVIALLSGTAMADPVILSGFDAEEQGGKSGFNNNNGWQFLQDTFYLLGGGATGGTLVVLMAQPAGSAKTDASTSLGTAPGGTLSAILNSFAFTGVGDADHPDEKFLGYDGWQLAFVSEVDVAGFLSGGMVNATVTSFDESATDGSQWQAYTVEGITRAGTDILYVPSDSSAGIIGALNDPGLLAYLSGGALFVGANNYGDWTTLLGLPAGSVGAGDPLADIEQPDWVLGGMPGFLANPVDGNVRGDVYSQIEDNTENSDPARKLFYSNSFTGFGGGSFTIFGSFSADIVFAIQRDVAPTTVPEPGFMMLGVLGAAWVATRRGSRRRR